MPLENRYLSLANVDFRFNLRNRRKIGKYNPVFWHHFLQGKYKTISAANFFNAVTDIPFKYVNSNKGDDNEYSKITINTMDLEVNHLEKLRKLEKFLLAENYNARNHHSMMQNAEVSCCEKYIDGVKTYDVSFYIPSRMLHNEKSINGIMHALATDKDDKNILMQRMLSSKQAIGHGMFFVAGVLFAGFVAAVVLLALHMITLPALPISITIASAAACLALPTSLLGIGSLFVKSGNNNDKEIHERTAVLEAKASELGSIPSITAHNLSPSINKSQQAKKSASLDNDILPYINDGDVISSNVRSDIDRRSG
ncbi:hypothetical protein CAXC1_310031 [Candidatus Xenohaliotis californiensis]|uniref:Uncharacterized protein n=1 Tax=Candidatus Xenohaliotis californiensis TaxID=84677 RepID=A0ABM9N887_9RICK|nr:hypothetical protein CAXC1_310031 [Candidatus Xenohaliotis californiensis]